ncbi:MAG: adenine deaminase C-terminal domain-containing protein, partial [Clostridia bacterium]
GTAEEMSGQVGHLGAAWNAIGCTLPAPFMTMALLSLACIPELRLTNRGLVDCCTFAFTPLFV